MTTDGIDSNANGSAGLLPNKPVRNDDVYGCGFGLCCLSLLCPNTLHTGFRLGSEAVEKLLKAFIFLKAGARTKLRGNDRHNPYLLKEELKAVHPDSKLDAYDALLHKLYDHYQSRYFDNIVTGKGASSEELPQIDELFIYLIETLPMPDEVKCRTMFFTILCEERIRQHWRSYHWATVHNRALGGKMETIERTYKQVLEHLYPAKNG